MTTHSTTHSATTTTTPTPTSEAPPATTAAPAVAGDTAQSIVDDLVKFADEYDPGPNQKLRDIVARARTEAAKQQK
jgi:hypothetical protein